MGLAVDRPLRLMAPTSKSGSILRGGRVARSASVVAGGVLGTLARWAAGEIIPSSPLGFPWGTLVVNVTGAFALGVIGVVLIERVARIAHLRAFLAIGLLGSYTTFSTMALEGVQLIEAQRIGLAAGYWISTLVVGQMAGVYGMWLGQLRGPSRKETG
jgi:CrcB protein